MPVDVDALRVELARRKLTQTQLARLLDLSPTTFSSWVRGAHPAPDDLARKIEKTLGLAPGALTGGSLQ
jgi:plasmid maintenance system antidote protein VapI